MPRRREHGGRGASRGEGKCRHGKQRGKCRECRGDGEAAGGDGRGWEEPETQRREMRARTTLPQTKARITDAARRPPRETVWGRLEWRKWYQNH